MCKYCIPDVDVLIAAVREENSNLRRLFPDPVPLFDADDDESSPGTDLRVQACDGEWLIHTGSEQFDPDHRGIWAHTWLPWSSLSLEDAKELAEELLEQLLDELVQTGSGQCP